VLLGPARLLAQGDTPEVVLHAYALRYQSAADAVGLVRPLLSPHGTVELQPAANTLAAKARIADMCAPPSSEVVEFSVNYARAMIFSPLQRIRRRK